ATVLQDQRAQDDLQALQFLGGGPEFLEQCAAGGIFAGEMVGGSVGSRSRRSEKFPRFGAPGVVPFDVAKLMGPRAVRGRVFYSAG
ncbi:unnamed protein product, partial [Prorocentrum cordatum]